jgi:hypothetical protein
MKYKNGCEVKAGDVIRWKCWDSDDFVTWTFTGLVLSDGVVYLGGGIDFGLGIGQIKSFDEVVSESENNDSYDVGIEYLCAASEIQRHIKNYIKGDV